MFVLELPQQRIVWEISCRSQLDFEKSQDISNSAWASARLLIRDSRLWTALSAAAQEAMPHFAPQKISNTAWGFSTIEVRVVKHDKNASSCKHFLMDYIMDHDGLVWKSGIHISTCMLPLMIFCITLLNYDFPHTCHSLCFLETKLERPNESVSQSGLLSFQVLQRETQQNSPTECVNERIPDLFLIKKYVTFLSLRRKQKEKKMLTLCIQGFNSAYSWGVSLLLFWNLSYSLPKVHHGISIFIVMTFAFFRENLGRESM